VTDLAVAICTYRRNGPLRDLLERLLDEAASTTEAVRLGVAVIDDSPTGEAQSLAAEFNDRFALGVTYRNTASGNISTARNAAVEAGIALGEWVMFIDDDCLPAVGWFAHLFGVQRDTGADLVTGPIRDVAPVGSPRWITEQPFLNMISEYEDRSEPPYGTTANVLISADWLRSHPQVRFRPELGRLGGEDMVFFETARAAGIRHRYSLDAVVVEQIPLARTTFRYQLRNKLWFGNTIYVTNLASGTSRNRLALRGARQLVGALTRPFARAAHREPPQWRYAAAGLLQAVGLLAGRVGVRLNHH